MKLVVQRSALKMWLMAMGGIPLLIISLDVLTERRITRWLTDIIFRPEDVQIYEPRDVIYAWAMVLFAAFIVLFGLKELFAPTKVVQADENGISLQISGPFRRATKITWENIRDIGGAFVLDEGDEIPLLVISVFDRGDLPENPWGARWVEERELGILAQDWSEEPEAVAERIADFAVEVARRRTRETTPGLWQEE